MRIETKAKLMHLAETKALIKNALNEKGIAISDSDTFRSYADSIRNTEFQSPDVRYVTFMNGEATLYVKPVATGDDCVNVLTKGLITTPKKESTVDKVFTYSGWAATDGGAADANVLKAVTKDKTVYAAFTESVRYYTVRFYDGETLLKTEWVAYGGTSSYVYDKEGHIFDGWNPIPENITDNIDCYGTWTEKPNFATSSWADIVSICEAGKAESIFNIGDTRSVVLQITSSATITVPMQIVGFNHDDLADGSGKASISLVSVPVVYFNDFSKDSSVTGSYWVDIRYHASLVWGTGSGLHGLCSNQVYSYLPAEVKATIKEVKKKYWNYDKVLSESNDKLWIPSAWELVENPQYTSGRDGNLYPYFDSNQKRKKKNISGTAKDYNTRTPGTYSDSFPCGIDTDGQIDARSGANGYFAFGFCI